MFNCDQFAEAEALVEATKASIEVNDAHSASEIFHRRMIVEDLRFSVEAVLIGELSDSWRERWLSLRARILPLTGENFTRQVRSQDDVSVIMPFVTNFSLYPPFQQMNRDEKRVYMGLHMEPYNGDGLTLITTRKPRYNFQPMHAHGVTTEYSLAVQPMNGVALMSDSKVKTLQALAGEMLSFGVGTPHYLQNPDFNSATDVTVKVPAGQNDRISLDLDSVGQYLEASKDKVFRAMMVVPREVSTGEGCKEIVYEVGDCGYKYIVHFLELQPGAVHEISHLKKMKDDAVGMMQVFSPIFGMDTGVKLSTAKKQVLVRPGEVAVLPPEVQSWQMKNVENSPSFVYCVYEVENL